MAKDVLHVICRLSMLSRETHIIFIILVKLILYDDIVYRVLKLELRVFCRF